MKVVILRSNPVAPDPRVEKEARALSGAGYSVIALGWDRTAALPVRESREAWEIIRLPIRAPFGQGLGNLRSSDPLAMGVVALVGPPQAGISTSSTPVISTPFFPLS